MKKALLANLAPIALLAFSGCVSAGILSIGKKYVRAETRSEAIQHYGNPILTRSITRKEIQEHGKSEIPSDTDRFEIYQYIGLMRNEGAMGAATLSAMTLGLGEAVLIPMAVVEHATDVKRYLFVAFYNSKNEMLGFRPLKSHEYSIADSIENEG